MIWLETKYGLAEVSHGFVKFFLRYNPAMMRFFLKDSLRIKKAQVSLKTFCTRNLSFSIRKLLQLIPIISGRVARSSPAERYVSLSNIKVECLISNLTFKKLCNYSIDEDSRWNTDDSDRTDFYECKFYLIIFNPLLSEKFLYCPLTQNCFNLCWSVKSVSSVCYFSLYTWSFSIRFHQKSSWIEH